MYKPINISSVQTINRCGQRLVQRSCKGSTPDRVSQVDGFKSCENEQKEKSLKNIN